jgi:hypothetical protein
MYHCAYSCPCHDYRNPLDYAPDRGSGRNVAKRSIGARFITRKRSRLDDEVVASLEVSVDNETVEELIRSDEEEEGGSSRGVEPMDSDYEPGQEAEKESRKQQRRRASSDGKRMSTNLTPNAGATAIRYRYRYRVVSTVTLLALNKFLFIFVKNYLYYSFSIF